MKRSDIPEDFFRVCKLNELTEKTGRRFFVNDTEIALFKIGGSVFAVNNICPHQHSAIIYDGIIEDDYVICPVHGWKFNLKTGKQPSGYSGINSYDVLISENDIYVRVLKKELSW